MARNRYARGSKALAECGRSGKRVPYRDLVEDGHIPRLLVAPDWWEPKHPQETPPNVADPVALYRPSPEISAPPGEGTPVDVPDWLYGPLFLNWSVNEVTQDGQTVQVLVSGGEPPLELVIEWVGDHEGLEFVLAGPHVSIQLVDVEP